MAYTYLIGWTTHNKWYYGVRFAKECKPEDLWAKRKAGILPMPGRGA